MLFGTLSADVISRGGSSRKAKGKWLKGCQALVVIGSTETTVEVLMMMTLLSQYVYHLSSSC
jgi:hypothetical protein